MKKSLVMLLAGFAAAVALVACGGDDGPGTSQAASTNLAVPTTAAAASTVQNVPFTFAFGVPDLGTTGTTSVAFTTTGTAPAFKIDNAFGTASGASSFGSCIFQVTTSTFPASHPLAAGKNVTINPCTLNLATSGAPANGTAVQRNITLQLGAASSSAAAVTVTISSTGAVTVNGATLGNVSVVQISG